MDKSIDKVFEKLEVMKSDFDVTFDDLRDEITERHFYFLNLRMKPRVRL